MTDHDHQHWVRKHRPERPDDVQGNTSAIDRLKDWAESFPDDRTPRLLIGDPGTGKTTTVEAIANWLDLQMVEINASSARRKADVAEMASTIGNRSVDGDRRVVLLDEVDSWSSRTDLTPLYDALEAPSNLVFATANDKYDTPSGLVRRCETETFRLGKRSRKARLKKIRDAEDLDLADDTLDALADRPDLRSAINDLQVYGAADDAPDDVREWDTNEWDMVDKMLTGVPARGQHRPGEAIMWLDENIRKDWRGLELAWGYEALSRADVALMQDHEIAGAIVDTLAELRLTEPYYGEGEGIGRKKEFPGWFQASKPKATRSKPEACLYRDLSNYESGEPGLSASYVEFRERVLPQLRGLSTEQKCELALGERLSDDAMEGLDLQPSTYEDWLEHREPEEGDPLHVGDASAW